MKWFKHDSRANRDAKIEKLLLKFGADGYALFWLCLELIADRIDADCLDFELEHDAETLGGRLKVDTLRVEEIMRWMVKEGLFEQSGERITCMKLAKRLDASIVRNPGLAAMQKASKRLETSGTFADDDRLVRERPEQIRLDKIRLEKKEKEREAAGAKSPASVRHKFGKFKNVLLTEDERAKLDADYPNAAEAIEYLSEYREMKGYKAKSDNLALRKWVFLAIKEDALKRQTIEAKERQAAGVEEFKPSPLPAFSRDMVPEAPTAEEEAQIDIDALSAFRGAV